MEALMVYGGNNILDMTFKKMYQQNPAHFKGAVQQQRFSYSYELGTPPVVVLETAAATPAHNIRIRLAQVLLKVTPLIVPPVSTSHTVAMTAFGTLKIAGGLLSLQSVTVKTDNPGSIDAGMLQVLNSHIAQALGNALAAVRLPQLEHIFGTGLTAQLRTGNVIPAGPALEIAARLSGSTGITAADQPATTGMTALNTGSSSNALIVATISAPAVNKIIKANAEKISVPFKETAELPLGLAGRIKGKISASTPVLSISDGEGRIKTTVSITLEALMRGPLGWSEPIPVAVPDVHLTITNKLSTNGKKGVIKLTGVSSISVSLNWPFILHPVEKLVENLLNGVLSNFKGAITDAVKKIEPVLFDLPDQIPATGFQADLSYENLAYYKSSVKATVRIRG